MRKVHRVDQVAAPVAGAVFDVTRDPTRIESGMFYNKNWVQKYEAERAYTSDKRYHYLGSGACYYQMGESMGRAMVDLISGAK